MLIFDKGLYIKFVDDHLERKVGVIKSVISNPEGFEKGTRYVVDAYEYERGTILKCYSISENQILKVLIKDTENGFDVWVNVDDLYILYPNRSIIKPDTIYRIDIDGRTHKTEEEDKSMLTNLVGKKIGFETIDGVTASRRIGLVIAEIVAGCNYKVLVNGSLFDIDSKQIKAIYDEDTKRWTSRMVWENAHSFSKEEMRYLRNDKKAVRLATREMGWRMNPKKVIFNGPATIVIWKDNTKTIVKRREGEEDDREKAVMYAILKKVCGNKAGMDRYLKQFFKEVESNEEKAD